MTALLLLAAATALLVLPGAGICLAAGTRWRDAVAAGPALTLAVVAVGSAVTAAADLRWGLVSAGVTALAALACAATVGIAGRVRARSADRVGGRVTRRLPGEGDDDEVSRRGPGPGVADLVVVLLAAIPAVQVLVATRGLTAIPQGWDAIFHGGATRFIAETGRAGVTDLGPVSQPANPHFFYPDTYHALAALLLALPGELMPGVLDALSAVTGVAFVLGAAVFAGRVCGGSRLAAVGAAMVAASAWTFPYLALGRGPVLPFALGVAVIPGVVLLGEQLAARRPGMVAHALLLGAGMVGAWSVHPSVALAAAIPLAAQALAGVVAAPGLRPRLAVAGGFILAAVPAGLYAGWSISMTSAGTAESLAGFSWPREVSVPRAVAAVFDLGPTPVASVGITVAVLLGLVAAVVNPARRRALAAPVAALVVYGALYVLAAAVEGDWVRTFTGFWWDDFYRFSSLLVLPAAVLAGAGVRALIPRGSARRPEARTGVAVAALLGVLAASGHAVLARDLRVWGYDDGPAVNAQERIVLDALAERHDGGVVLNDPFDGTAWAYALHGVPVVFGAPLADDPLAQVGGDRMVLYTSANRYGFDPVVTRIVRDLDVRWVVVGTGAVGGPGRPGGFIGLRFNPHLRLVEETSGARLYEVLPVPADHPPLLPPPGIPAVTPGEQPANTDTPLVDLPLVDAPLDDLPVDDSATAGPTASLDGAIGS
ncbi:DUF6541 family protein [Rhodococcus sp. IEGM 1408]|uniref:DUF6541 family protein n=1 Tax=Rhodococcus sp. IEGM 1408 TaxID=3082220 RepID=UPI002952AF4D|nr:DUF6541 family protein [Rhodococcus sp. IEGM 1408]MDV8002110.1 DUF6541 family protein [Rhodococcus sp. IEGM 1408]